MRWDVLTLFPGMFAGPLSESIIKRAVERGLVEVALHDIRAQATDRHRTVDDTPYGGGGGAVSAAPAHAAAGGAAARATAGRGAAVHLSSAAQVSDGVG